MASASGIAITVPSHCVAGKRHQTLLNRRFPEEKHARLCKKSTGRSVLFCPVFRDFTRSQLALSNEISGLGWALKNGTLFISLW